jgi:DNA recombination protein RmuC
MSDVVLVLVAVAAVSSVIGPILLLRRPSCAAREVAAAGEVRFSHLERGLERVERSVREDLERNRDGSAEGARLLRAELQSAVGSLASGLRESVAALGTAQREALDAFARELGESRRAADERFSQLRESLEARLESARSTVDTRLQALQQENAEKLEQVRRTVDEQLQGTLERRLGESFHLVSERLEQVYRGLGEMRTLATGVGDLKKVLSNVRTRGTWGEIQLGALLEDILHPDQYGRNVATTRGSERVEFAIRLPGTEPDSFIWLPIDAKFPQEDYSRLMDATERGDTAAMEVCARQLEQRMKSSAREIHQKYVGPPHTTDFAVMYLPTEGLFSEALRRPGLVENLQRDHRVVVAGPTTLAALLSSLQMGFRTLAVQQRSSEVWHLLGAVKTEFAKYGDFLQKVQKKLQEASNTVDLGLTRTRVLQRQLEGVESPVVIAAPAIRLDDPADTIEQLTLAGADL